MRIVITGTPGTGKTRVAEELAGILGVRFISIRRLVEKEKIFEVKGMERVVDVNKLEKVLKKTLRNKRNYVIEGHLACETRLPCDYIFVLRTHPRELRKRLLSRGYSAKKIRENLMSEMLDYCVQRVVEVYGKKPVGVDTTGKTVGATGRRIAGMIRNKKKKGDRVDYSKELVEYLGLKKHARRKKTD
jgi:adenylate kinase